MECSLKNSKSSKNEAVYYVKYTVNTCLFISGVFFISGVQFFTSNNFKMHTFNLLIVEGDTLRLLIVKCVSYD